jgi:hypothetical protein
MCDYSLHAVKTRPAKIGDKLITSEFKYTPTRGLTSTDDPETAVCLLPGTEIAFESPAKVVGRSVFASPKSATSSCVARFRKLDIKKTCEHHDAFEFADGKVVKIDELSPGQKVTVLQLPPQKKVLAVIVSEEKTA